MININNCQGDLIDTSAKTKPLVKAAVLQEHTMHVVQSSEEVAEAFKVMETLQATLDDFLWRVHVSAQD